MSQKAKKTTLVKDKDYYHNLILQWDRHSQNRPHCTGMVDYVLWVRLFQELPPAPDEPYRRGAVWA